MSRLARALVVLALAAPFVAADVILLTDRTRIEGKVLAEEGDVLLVETYAEGPVRIQRSRIARIYERVSKIDTYLRELDRTEDTADDQYRLARWCKGRGLIYRSEQHFGRAIEIDPDHEKARKALGHRQVDGRWMSEEEYQEARGYVRHEGRWITREAMERLGIANTIRLELTVAVKADADRAYLAGLRDRMEKAAEAWWECTEGQMVITRVHIVDRADAGDIVIHNLDSPKWLPGKEYGRVQPDANRTVYLGGLFPLVTFCHELGHRYFQLPEEYVDPKCGHCVMNPWTGVFVFCDDGDHTGAGEDCWTRILRLNPKWSHPHAFGKCPAVEITIEDR